MKQPDRLEAAHGRHQDIDDHQIETGLIQRSQAVGAAIRDRDPEPIPLQPRGDRETDMPVIIDHENATHGGLPRRFPHALDTRRRRNGDRQTTSSAAAATPGPRHFALRISALFSFPPQIDRPVCPPGCIGLLAQLLSSRAGKHSDRHVTPWSSATVRALARERVQAYRLLAIAGGNLVVAAFQRACPHLETTESDQAADERHHVATRRLPDVSRTHAASNERRADMYPNRLTASSKKPVNCPCQPYGPGSSSPNSECTY